MMACKSFMCIFMDLLKVIFFAFFLNLFFFFCLCVKAFSFLRFFFERVFVVFDY